MYIPHDFFYAKRSDFFVNELSEYFLHETSVQQYTYSDKMELELNCHYKIGIVVCKLYFLGFLNTALHLKLF